MPVRTSDLIRSSFLYLLPSPLPRRPYLIVSNLISSNIRSCPPRPKCLILPTLYPSRNMLPLSIPPQHQVSRCAASDWIQLLLNRMGFICMPPMNLFDRLALDIIVPLTPDSSLSFSISNSFRVWEPFPPFSGRGPRHFQRSRVSGLPLPVFFFSNVELSPPRPAGNTFQRYKDVALPSCDFSFVPSIGTEGSPQGIGDAEQLQLRSVSLHAPLTFQRVKGCFHEQY